MQEHRCLCQEGPLWLAEQVVSHLHYNMTTKIIHFMVNGRLEQAEFGAECSTTDVKGEKRPEACCTTQAYIVMYLIGVNSEQICFCASFFFLLFFLYTNNLPLANSLIVSSFFTQPFV